MPRIIERHRVPLGPQYTLIYQRSAERQPLEVSCSFRLGYADGQPGEVYALFKAFQNQYSSAWRPRLTLTPDWARLHFIASPEYRRELDDHWLQLLDLSAALTPLEPLRQGLLQEQRWHHDALPRRLQQLLQQLAFAGSAYDRPPLGEATTLQHWNQEDLMSTYEQLLSAAPLYLCIQDHQPLHQVLERLRPLLQRQQQVSTLPAALPLRQSQLREEHLALPTEGAWLYAGLALPGRDHPHWIVGPLLRAWLAQAWADRPASNHLHCLESQWMPWQRASLLQLCLHSHQASELASHKQALIEWLASLRQHYLTPRRLKAALESVLQESQSEETPLFVAVDEMLSGWGHGRQRLQQLTLEGFQHLLEQYLNAEHLVLLSACAPHVPLRQLPDYRKSLPKLGLAPSEKSAQAGSSYYTDLQRLHLGPEQSAWVIPQTPADGLQIGLWFASGSAHERVAGSTWAVLQRLRQSLLQQYAVRGKGAWKPELSWHSDVQAECSFFQWQVHPQEWPQALQLLQDLLQDLQWPQREFETFRLHAQTTLLARALHPEYLAQEQFMASGFPNHPYALPALGTPISQRQWQPLLLAQRWQAMRQGPVQPLLLGKVPSELRAEALQDALEACRPSAEAPASLPAVRTRRGEIVLKSFQLNGFRLEGQVLSSPLPLEQMLALQLAAQWLEDRTRTRQGLPLNHALQFFSQAWTFCFWGLYDKQLRENWLAASQQPDSSLGGLKPRFLAERKLKLQHSGSRWSELVRWLQLGGTPGAFMDQERHLLALPQDALAESLNWFQNTQDWLQIVFQTENN